MRHSSSALHALRESGQSKRRPTQTAAAAHRLAGYVIRHPDALVPRVSATMH
jgi:hypothetical protein